MGVNTNCSDERIGTEWEATFTIREAGDLKQMTLKCYDIDDFLDMELCVGPLQQETLAVREEAQRLESEVACYSEKFQIRLSGNDTESSSIPQDPTSGGELEQDALDIVGEVERIKQLVLSLCDRIAESIQEGKNTND